MTVLQCTNVHLDPHNIRQHTTSLHRTAYTRRRAPDFSETSMCSPAKDRPPMGAARRRSRLPSQYLPNSACRGSIKCIALRSFEAFWYVKTLVGLRHRPRCWISSRSRTFFHGVPRGPSVSQTVCHHSQLATNRVLRKWSSLRVRSRFDPLE